MDRRFSIILLITGLLLYSCSDLFTEPEVPDWEGSIQFLMLKDVVNIDSLITDDRLQSEVGLDGIRTYFFHDSLEIDTFSVGDRLTMDDMTSSFSQTVSDIEIGNDSQSEFFSMDQVSMAGVDESFRAEVGDVEMTNIPADTTSPVIFTDVLPQNLVDILTDFHNNGQTPEVAIPEYDLDPIVKYIDFSQYYNIHVSTGQLQLTIENNLPIDLGAPVTVEVYETGSQLLATTVFNNPIPVNGQAVQNIVLDNMDFGNSLEIQILAHINGTGIEEIPIAEEDMERPFIVIGEFLDLIIFSGNAEVPEQTFSGSESYSLDPSEPNQIERAGLVDGVLNLSAVNELPVDLALDLHFSSIRSEISGEELSVSLDFTQSNTLQDQINLNGYELLMDLADQSIQYSYHAATIASDGLVEIFNTDAIAIDFSIMSQNSSEIIFEHVTGLIEPQTLDESGAIELETDAEIQYAEIQNGSVIIDIINNIGGSGDITIDILDIQEVFQFGPGSNNYLIDLSNETLNFNGQQIIDYTANIVTSGSQLMSYDLTDSIEVILDVADLEFGLVTGYFHNESFSSSDSLDIDSEHIIEHAQINTGSLNLVFHNHMGIAANLNLTIPELIENNDIFTRDFVLTDQSSPQHYNFPLDDQIIQLPMDNQLIHYNVDAVLNNSELLTVDLQDSIEVDVTISDMHFKNVTGIIAPVEVEIEPVEKIIEDIPDSPGIEFEEISMIVDIESEITLPVLVDFHISAVNPDGETASVDVTNWNVTDSSSVIIPNAAELINIFPELITVTGVAVVGDAIQNGSIDRDQFVTGISFVDIPLSFTVTDPRPVESDTETMEMDLDSLDEILGITITADVDNHFPIGAQLLLFADDENSALESIDPLDNNQFTLVPFHRIIDIPPSSATSIDVSVDEADIDLFSADSTFIKIWITLAGQTDGQGNPIPSTITSNDSLTYRTIMTVNYLLGEDE